MSHKIKQRVAVNGKHHGYSENKSCLESSQSQFVLKMLLFSEKFQPQSSDKKQVYFLIVSF